MRRPSFLFKCKIRPGKTRISFEEKQICGGFPLRDVRFKRVFRKCGGNRKSLSTPRFWYQNRRLRKVKTGGLVCRFRIFPALSESLDGNMRQISEPSSAPPFPSKETAGRSVVTIRRGRHVNNLQHTSGLGAHLAPSKSPHPLKKFLKQP